MQAEQLNVEYFFRLFYDCYHGTCYLNPSYAGLFAFLAHLWLWIIVTGYALAVLGMILIIYEIMRLFDLREREGKFYGTILVSPESTEENPRWVHIQELADSNTPSAWREAIIEADIMLDDMLTRQGYSGDGLGEKLKQAQSSQFATLNDAWEAHKVRNQIAHEGSSFDLSESLARRTIQRCEAVFHEFEAI